LGQHTPSPKDRFLALLAVDLKGQLRVDYPFRDVDHDWPLFVHPCHRLRSLRGRNPSKVKRVAHEQMARFEGRRRSMNRKNRTKDVDGRPASSFSDLLKIGKNGNLGWSGGCRLTFFDPRVPNKQGSLKRGVEGSPARAIRPPGWSPAKLAHLS
jgi:hypothetical protein